MHGGVPVAGAAASASAAPPGPHATPAAHFHASPAVQAATRRFFLGLFLALLFCIAHVAWDVRQHPGPSRRPQPGATAQAWARYSWREELEEEAARQAAGSIGTREIVSGQAADAANAAHLAALAAAEGRTLQDADEEAPVEIPPGRYSLRAVVDRFLQRRELTHLNDTPAAEARAFDASSWQSTMARQRMGALPRATQHMLTGSGIPAGLSRRAAMALGLDNAYSQAEAAIAAAKALAEQTSRIAPPARPHPLVGPAGAAYYAKRTLVLYLFYPADQESLSNLEFFVRHAVRAHHTADYVLIMQRNELRPYNASMLPSLPSNAKYVDYVRRDECGGLGPIGWLLRHQHPTETASGTQPAAVQSVDDPHFVAFGHYEYVMVVDSSMRGPWFPSWIDLDDPARVWYAAFAFHLERHIPDMHLVGATISCQYGQPHVQLGAFMLSRQGWDAVDANRTALLRCVPPWKSTAAQAMQLSSTLLSLGSNIGSQMLALQDVDFRAAFESPLAQSCLGMRHADPQYDELQGDALGPAHYMDPYEVVFVKYTSEFKHYKSETYSDWKRWEAERILMNAQSDRYARRWTETDFRIEEEIRNKDEEARLQPLPG